MQPDVQRIDHPLIEHSLSVLRARDTGTAEFRQHAGIVSKLLMLEATRTLRLRDCPVHTPLAKMTGKTLDESVVVVPVLRAGLAMLFAAQDFLLDVSVGFLGLERDEKTAIAREYYQKLPEGIRSQRVLVLDPMLATGGSLDETVHALQSRGVQDITLVCIVAAPEGVARIHQRYPEVHILTAAMDERLDERKFIVPGLGDFGDRYFGTESRS